jgi:hypothetical protein
MHSSADASGSVPNSDTDSPLVPSETSEQKEGAKRQGEFSDVDEADMEKAGSGQMDRNKASSLLTELCCRACCSTCITCSAAQSL